MFKKKEYLKYCDICKEITQFKKKHTIDKGSILQQFLICLTCLFLIDCLVCFVDLDYMWVCQKCKTNF